MPPARVSQSQIAKVSGFSRMTVSYALRNHPKIPQKTRDIIWATAKKLHYAPDPMLSALMAYRRSSCIRYTSTIAWINNQHHLSKWRTEIPIYQLFWDSALARCKELGYKLEEFWLKAPGMTPKRLSQILQTRNITAAILMPQPTSRAHLNLDWDKLSLVTIGHSLVNPRLHMVSSYHYRNMAMTMRKLRSLGYRRIGFHFHSPLDERADHSYLAGFLIGQQLFQKKDRIPFYGENFNEKKFLHWVSLHKPQAIITSSWNQSRESLKKAGYKVPEDIGIIAALVHPGENYFAGIDEQPHLIGTEAVDFLHSSILRNERGIPDSPARIFVEGVWKQNSSVRRLNK